MNLPLQDKINLVNYLFPFRHKKMDVQITAICSMFIEIETYDLYEFKSDLVRAFGVSSPFPERKRSEIFTQLTLF